MNEFFSSPLKMTDAITAFYFKHMCVCPPFFFFCEEESLDEL